MISYHHIYTHQTKYSQIRASRRLYDKGDRHPITKIRGMIGVDREECAASAVEEECHLPRQTSRQAEARFAGSAAELYELQLEQSDFQSRYDTLCDELEKVREENASLKRSLQSSCLRQEIFIADLESELHFLREAFASRTQAPPISFYPIPQTVPSSSSRSTSGGNDDATKLLREELAECRRELATKDTAFTRSKDDVLKMQKALDTTSQELDEISDRKSVV